MLIRPEVPADINTIRALITQAFKGVPYSHGCEADIVETLRRDRQLTLSWLAEIDGCIAGHVAFSPVTIDGREAKWYGLGPVSVTERYRQRGIATALIENGVEQLKGIGAEGCVVLGSPAFYRRFGFELDASLYLDRAPPHYFQRLVLHGEPPTGRVNYGTAFAVHLN